MKSVECSEHLIELIRSAQIDTLKFGAPEDGKQKVVAVNTIDQVIEQLGASLIKRPAVGVMYEGARSTGGQQIGMGAEMVYSLFILTEKNVIAPQLSTLAVATESQVILDAVRAKIQGIKSPAGHKWKWVLEAAAATKGNLLVWVQRWSTAANDNPR